MWHPGTGFGSDFWEQVAFWIGLLGAGVQMWHPGAGFGSDFWEQVAVGSDFWEQVLKCGTLEPALDPTSGSR